MSFHSKTQPSTAMRSSPLVWTATTWVWTAGAASGLLITSCNVNVRRLADENCPLALSLTSLPPSSTLSKAGLFPAASASRATPSSPMEHRSKINSLSLLLWSIEAIPLQASPSITLPERHNLRNVWHSLIACASLTQLGESNEQSLMSSTMSDLLDGNACENACAADAERLLPARETHCRFAAPLLRLLAMYAMAFALKKHLSRLSSCKVDCIPIACAKLLAESSASRLSLRQTFVRAAFL
mmetsp:Transcript_15614/g.36550  ORF Transcript_15614/g.36550 Transcript_15614/m.36550 type:complete len:242 (+) Transcript_15614:1602-2327(+)